MKVVLATGVPKLNTKIEKKFIDEIEVVSKPLYNEALERSVAKYSADLIIFSDVLEGSLNLEDLILVLRARHPKTRIVFISKNLSKETKSFLYKYNVFDILNESFTEEEFRNALFKPKSWEDVSFELETLKNYKLDEESLKVDVDNLKKINKNEYKKISIQSTGKMNIYQEIIPFWSSIDQSGKTFLAVNSSLMLASNPDLKILLIDFNIKSPSIHLQFGFTDGDRNLGAFIEDMDEEMIIDSETFKDYLIVHPVYKNLFILPGYILNMADKTDEEYITYYEKIVEFASLNNYSTILVDIGSGISDLNKHILKSATKIIFVINESPNALYSAKKIFDPELGEYIPTLIGKKKLFPVINQSVAQYAKRFKMAFEFTLDGNQVISIIPKEEDIHVSIFDGTPFLKEIEDAVAYKWFFPVIDLIHPNFFKVPSTKPNPTSIVQKDSKEKKGFNLFGKNK